MDDLARRMAELGAPDPDRWAASEVRENIAQQARYLFLRAIWPQAIDAWKREDVIRRIPAGSRLLDAGASLADLSTLLRAATYETAFAVIERIDAGGDSDAPEDAPGWVLMETRSGSEITGRRVGGLHEDLLTLDTSDTDGADLRV